MHPFSVNTGHTEVCSQLKNHWFGSTPLIWLKSINSIKIRWSWQQSPNRKVRSCFLSLPLLEPWPRGPHSKWNPKNGGALRGDYQKPGRILGNQRGWWENREDAGKPGRMLGNYLRTVLLSFPWPLYLAASPSSEHTLWPSSAVHASPGSFLRKQKCLLVDKTRLNSAAF